MICKVDTGCNGHLFIYYACFMFNIHLYVYKHKSALGWLYFLWNLKLNPAVECKACKNYVGSSWAIQSTNTSVMCYLLCIKRWRRRFRKKNRSIRCIQEKWLWGFKRILSDPHEINFRIFGGSQSWFFLGHKVRFCVGFLWIVG